MGDPFIPVPLDMKDVGFLNGSMWSLKFIWKRLGDIDIVVQ